MATLVISDVHLCGIVSSGGPWMQYRQRENQIDAELAALIDSVQGATIVLNGDVFDLDAPDLRSANPVRDRSSLAASSLLGAILKDHPLVVEALRRSSAIVVIPGNHDAQLAYPLVQNKLYSRIGDFRFEPLFYKTPDGFHIEHGHQYDPLCSNNGPGDDSVGTVVTFYTPLIFGCASPYASDPLDTNWVEGLCGVASTDLTMAFLRDLMLVEPRSIQLPRAPHASLFAQKTLASGVIEQRAWKNYGSEACRRLRDAAGKIAGIYNVRGVVMGHTHVPFGEMQGGLFFGNSGSWVSEHPSYVWIEGGRAEMRYWR